MHSLPQKTTLFPYTTLFRSEIRYGELPKREELLKQAVAKLQEYERDGKRLVREEVTAEDIAEVISRWTGIPVSKMLQSEKRSEEHTSELQSRPHLVCRLLLE